VATTDPTEVLVVGTTSRPGSEPIDPCDTQAPVDVGNAFVSLYEYDTGARLNAPDHTEVYDTTLFRSRPADFTQVPATRDGECASATAPATTTTAPRQSSGRISDFAFLDAGRFFVARVVATGEARYREALEVLNTLQIDVPPDVTSTTAAAAAATTTTTSQGDDNAVAYEQITDDLRGAFGGGGPVSGDEAIAGGFPLGEAAKQEAKKGNESFIGVIVPRIDWLTLDTAEHATVNFDLLIDGQTITANTTGEALVIDGRWRITAETFCVVVRRGGVTCPNR